MVAGRDNNWRDFTLHTYVKVRFLRAPQEARAASLSLIDVPFPDYQTLAGN
jgi:hypothetical protein